MSELGEIYSAMREAGREKRASNRDTSPAILARHGVAFETKNDGAHLIVRHGGKVADFWPGTGKYNVRGVKHYRRGVFNLLRDLGARATDNNGAQP